MWLDSLIISFLHSCSKTSTAEGLWFCKHLNYLPSSLIISIMAWWRPKFQDLSILFACWRAEVLSKAAYTATRRVEKFWGCCCGANFKAVSSLWVVTQVLTHLQQLLRTLTSVLGSAETLMNFQRYILFIIPLLRGLMTFGTFPERIGWTSVWGWMMIFPLCLVFQSSLRLSYFSTLSALVPFLDSSSLQSLPTLLALPSSLDVTPVVLIWLFWKQKNETDWRCEPVPTVVIFHFSQEFSRQIQTWFESSFWGKLSRASSELNLAMLSAN